MTHRIMAALVAALLALVGLAVPSAPAAAVTGQYKIMPLGDSITRGVGQDLCGDTTPQNCAAYRKTLHNYLYDGAYDAGFRWQWVGGFTAEPSAGHNHQGTGGKTIEWIRGNIDAYQATYTPDIILLHIGTNNITQGDTAQQAADKLADLLARIRYNQPTVRVFVGRIIDVSTAVADEQELRNVQYANLVGQVVTEAGTNFYGVDFRDIGGDELYDYRHPNEFGYIKMAYRWYQAFRGVLPTSNLWANVSNPYTWPTYNICQYNYSTTTKVCAVQTVND